MGNKKSYMDYLHLFVFVAFAIAQPLYDLLGKYPEFFIAHSAKPGLIIGMIFFLSFGLPLVLVSIESSLHSINKQGQNGSHLVFVLALTVLIILPFMKKVTSSDFLVVAVSGTSAFLFTVLYARLQAARMFITLLLPVTLIFPLLFVFATSTSRLFLPHTAKGASEIEIKNPVSIVMIVFDEFNTTALLDSKERIDPVRFPNFAALASEASWFPNAITVSESTVKAIPAIVSGLKPKSGDKLMPTARDYPSNLFTMLEGKYEISVSEVYTALCPKEICVEVNNNSAYEKYRLFFSDLLVIYTHFIVPPIKEKTLPKLDGRWAGFLADKTSAERVGTQPTEIKYSRTHQKDEQLKRFLSQIKSSAKPQLFFMHTLLPHIPYGYLASGQQYSFEYKLPDGIISDKEGWLGEESLIVNAYHRYLQQVGYVDRFLGMLREKLISEAIYDDAMFIVMADHGVAFAPWQSRRVVNDVNKSEILKIPLFVKFPKQKQGRIERSIVTSADILPTIIDVIKADVRWNLDGVSLDTNQGDSWKGFDFVGFGFLSRKDIIGFPRLKWQIEHFGERTPLDSTVPKGPLNELVGSDLDDFQIGEAADAILISNNINDFQNVDVLDHFLPSLFSGYIKDEIGRNHKLAVAINGKVWITTDTSHWNENKNFFSVLLPKVALQSGQNNVSIYLIEQEGKKVLLKPVNTNRNNVNLRQIPDGNEFLVFANGKKVAVEKMRKNMDGYLDRISVEGEMLAFAGWAGDLVESQPASDIFFFRGETLVWQVAPNLRRDDVVKAFNRPSLSLSGYRTEVPLKAFESLSGDVTIIALSGDRRAFKINIKNEHKELISTKLSK